MGPESIVAVMIPLTFLGMLALEQVFKTGRAWPEIPWWRAKGIAFFIALMMLNSLLPSLVPRQWASHHLVDGAVLGVLGGVVLGYPVVSLLNASLHRAYHRYPVLWRYVHQLHHAPQRLDIAGSMVLSPLQVCIGVAASFTMMVFVLGLDPLAAAITGYIVAFNGMFQHLNLRTPQWLGYVIQRPESHGVHHRRGFHAYNYSDFPVWDMLWGTFRNPKHYLGEVGFEREAATRIGAMLLGRDVNVADLGPASRGSANPASNPA